MAYNVATKSYVPDEVGTSPNMGSATGIMAPAPQSWAPSPQLTGTTNQTTSGKVPAVISDTTIRDKVIPGIKSKADTMLAPYNVTQTSQNAPGQAPTTQSSQTPTPPKSTYEEDYKQTLKDMGIDVDSPAISDEQQSLFDAMSRENDAATQQQLSVINRRYDEKNRLLDQQQRGTSAELSGRLMNAGSNQYAPLSTASIKGLNMADQIREFNDLQDEEQNLVAEANNAKSQADYKILGDKLDLLQKKKDEKLSLANKIADGVTKENQDIRDKQDADAKELKTAKDNLLLQVTKNGAPAEVKDAIKNAPTYSDAITASSGHLQSPEDVLDMQYKKAQMSKIYSDIQHDRFTETNSGSDSMDPSEIIAYAQQYATTGKIPTGLPKGTFGKVADVAKELPKQPGELIDTKTGVKPDINDADATAFASIYSSIELAKQLKELDKKRTSGVLTGILPSSKEQTEYLSLRTQITDLLGHSRSGAALNQAEVDKYEGMLPSKWAQPFFVGVDPQVQIDNFIHNLSSDLQNKASSNGFAVNGISKVDLGGTKYTVGDVITNAQGQKGRVNADGTITSIN